jgi:MFS family permease
MAATFYQAAFAALTRWYGPQRIRALTTLTLAGGLASTVFAPVTAALAGPLGWRHTYLILAATLLLVTAPLHWLALRGTWVPSTAHLIELHHRTHSASETARSKPFILLAVALTMSGFAMYAVVFGLIPLLLDRGLSPTAAALALGLGGLGQTLGRLLYIHLAKHTTAVQRTTMLVLAGGVTTTFIALTPGSIWLLMVAAMAAGAVRGNLTLLQATAVTDRWGATHYARLTAVLTAPVTIAGALAPWAGSALANQLGSYRSLFLALAGVSILATVFTHASRGTERNQRGEAQAAGIKIRHDPSHPRSKSRTDVVEERPSGTVAT